MGGKIKEYKTICWIVLGVTLALGLLSWLLLPESCLAPFASPEDPGAYMDKLSAVLSLAAVGLGFDAAFYFTRGRSGYFLLSLAGLVLEVCLLAANLF